MKQVILGGFLGKKYGRIHWFDIGSAAEAVRALIANFEGFNRDLVDSEKHGIGYKIWVDNDLMPDVEQIQNPCSQTIRISPVITGGKSGFLGVVLGAVLIAAVALFPVTAGAVLFGTTTVGSMVGGMGISLLLGGVMSLLSPQPKMQAPLEAPENTPSYAFDGPVNTTRQGQCVPVGYGRLIVGSATISAGISAEEYKIEES